MVSQNFSFLNNKWPSIYEYATKAEEYIFSDPPVAIVKLRCYAELLVGELYEKLSLSTMGKNSLYERLSYERFRNAVPNDVITKLHAIRIWGNKAAHGKTDLDNKEIILLKDAYLLGKWFYRTVENYDGPYPDFKIPNCSPSKNESNSFNTKRIDILKESLSDLSQLQSKNQHTSNANANEPDDNILQDFAKNGLRVATEINMESDKTAKLLNIKDVFSEYNLSHDQTILVEKFDEFLKNKDLNVFLLQGYAGTGKTFITKGLTEYFKIIGRNYILAAPTGKAAKVIATKTNSTAYTIHKTIYSFKTIKEYSQEIEGTETFKFYAELAINTNSVDTVYIVDEASMISDKYQEAEFFRFGSGFLLRDFLKFVNIDHNDHRKKIIFIGDNAQLPPVGMNFSPALDVNYLQKNYNLNVVSYKLTDVIRQKEESGIIKNAFILRKSIDEKCFNKLNMDSSLSDVQEIKYDNIIEDYYRACNGKISNNSILIAFSNADVTAYNFAIRKRLLPGCKDEISRGDKIMANNNNAFYGFFISNGDFGIVRNVRGNTEIRNITIKRKNHETNLVEEIKVALHFRDVELGFRDENGDSRFFDAKILENLLYSDKHDLSSDETKALYVDFCIRYPHLKRRSQEFRDTLKSDPYFNAIRIKFGYAITCHKAQGSEWQHVFVKCRNTNTGLTEGYFRWLYTAVTRASEYLYLIDPPKYKLTSGLKIIENPSLLSATENNISFTATMKADELGMDGGNNSSAHLSVVSEISTLPHEDASVLITPAVNEDFSETFGLTNDSPFLLEVLHKVRKLIAGTDIEIASIIHNNFHEAYFFKEKAETARVNIWYKANKTISSVVALDATLLGQKLISILTTPLKTTSFEQTHKIQHINFPESFLEEFYNEVKSVVSKHNINIHNVEFFQYSQRYTFIRGDEVAKFDIYYNSKKKFTKIMPFKSSKSSIMLEHDLIQLLAIVG